MTARRDFLAFTAGAVAAKTVLPIAARAEPDHPDVALVAFAERYGPAVEAFNAYMGPDGSPEDEALHAELYGVFAICMAAKPRTLHGLAAKARIVLQDAKHLNGDEMEPDQKADQMARSIVHDILRLVGDEA